MTAAAQDILQQMSVTFAPLLEDAGVVRCAVCGSYARGTATAASDVDLLVDFSPGQEPDLFAFLEIKRQLERLIGKSVDITTSDALSSYIRADILETAQTLYERR